MAAAAESATAGSDAMPFVRPHPADDFNLYVNGEWESQTKIPDDQTRWGSFMILREDNLKRLREILESDEMKGTPIQVLYVMASQPAATVPAGAAAALASVATGVTDAASYWRALATTMLSGQGRSVFLHICKSEDAKNPELRVPHVTQAPLGLPDKSYYTDRPELHPDYKAYIKEITALFGYDDVDADAVFELEKAVAEVFLTPTERRDPEKVYNKREWAEVAAALPDFVAALPHVDAAKMSYAVVENPALLAFLPQKVASTPAKTLRDHLVFMLADGLATRATEATLAAHFKFRGAKLQGQKEMDPAWKRGLAAVERYLGDELGKVYVARHFPAEKRTRCQAMVDDLKAALKETLENLEWMGPETKAQALEKLHRFGVKIGVPEEWHSVDGLWGGPEPGKMAATLAAGDMATAHAAWVAWDWAEQEVKKFYTPPERKLWHMTPQTVNAYYHPEMNEIVFPAGILQPPFFHGDKGYEVDVGAIGVVIGHEMTHGFDDQGRKYNAKGEMQDWWSEADSEEFKKRAKVVRDHYAAQKVLGLPVNGDLTLGENIADIGGLKLALKAACRHFGTATLTQAQRESFFTAYALIWRMLIRDEMAKKFLAIDPHSPTHLRINAALGHIPEWYETYAVTPEHKLFLTEEERMKIW